MEERKLELSYGALLHDIGKVIYRSNHADLKGRNHSQLGAEYLKQFDEFKKQHAIYECIRYHHGSELFGNRKKKSPSAPIPENSLAYITYLADNIASGVDRRNLQPEDDVQEGEGTQHVGFNFKKAASLSSIFNILNEKEMGLQNYNYSFGTNEITKYPSASLREYTEGDYNGLKNAMDNDFRKHLKYGRTHFHSLLQWTEEYWKYIPSSTNVNQLTDISLFDHSKITCAIANCIFDYWEAKKIDNYKNELVPYSRTQNFYKEEVFLLASLDLSGIQDFIYNISGEKALKSLRARSFYLEILLEVIVDELLKRLKLNRSNLLYTGGGHAYLLLANTEETLAIFEAFKEEVTAWFLSQFRTDLYLACAYQACSGDALMNEDEQYKAIWQGVSRKLAAQKLNRYTAAEIMVLNTPSTEGERECQECYRSDVEIVNNLCPVCQALIEISNQLRDKNFFVVAEKGLLALPFAKKLSVLSKEEVEKKLSAHEQLQIYSKNVPHIGDQLCTNLWMCDYAQASEIATYAASASGIQRLGVLRADVDNLGATFMKGIPEAYNSISRTTTLSRQLSMFFKYEINQILKNKNAKVTVIYSGGDDLFCVGEWQEIIEVGIEIHKKFLEFTQGKLTFSAGIGIYQPKYPISRMASEVGNLEDAAKTGSKNQIALWTKEKVYHWELFRENILMRKVPFIEKAFGSTSEHGKAFIYKMLEFLRDSSQINIARLAYLLAKSSIKEADMQQLFTWSRDEVEREYLITAIEYYIYKTRGIATWN